MDYRGEIQIVLYNAGRLGTTIRPGQRIAQLVIAPVEHAKLFEVDQLSETHRSWYGFGSTGS